MEVVPLGKTNLSMEVILEYVESLKQIYTSASYDLFAHNCNNFTNDFAMFLVGRGIPKHITSLPETVLNTPFGMMLKPQLDREMRSITQAAVPPQAIPPQPTSTGTGSSSGSTNGGQQTTRHSQTAPQQTTLPPHPHDRLKLPLFKRSTTQPVTYNKVPPLDKLTAKMGSAGGSVAAKSAVDFISVRTREGSPEATLPDMPLLGNFFRSSIQTLPLEVLFASYDLMRLVVADPRASGYFAQEEGSPTFLAMLNHINGLQDCPYNLKLVSIHLSCNMFNSPVFEHLLHSSEKVASALVTLISNNLLDKAHANLRVAATSLAYNVTTALFKRRTQQPRTSNTDTTGFSENLQVELAASLIEALSAEEEGAEAIKGAVMSLGRLAYHAAHDSEVLDLYRAMDVSNVVLESVKLASKDDRPLISEVAKELLVTGLQ